MADPTTIRRLYGRTAGHKLRQGQAALLEEALPRFSVPEEGRLDSQSLFGDDRPLEFEIGFGAGEHLAGQALMRPEHGFIGCEPFLNGVVGALNHIREEKLANVRLHMGDALLNQKNIVCLPSIIGRLHMAHGQARVWVARPHNRAAILAGMRSEGLCP